MSVEYGVVEGACPVSRALFPFVYLFVHLLYLPLFLRLGHDAEIGQFLFQVWFLFEERQLLAGVPDPRSAHGFVGREGFVEAVAVSFDVVASDE
jgi:hypothetical protein